MSRLPILQLGDLGPQAQNMAKNCTHERTAMILHHISLGCMIVLTGVAVSQAIRDAFGSPNRGRGRSS